MTGTAINKVKLGAIPDWGMWDLRKPRAVLMARVHIPSIQLLVGI
jgi:hypothetical protein